MTLSIMENHDAIKNALKDYQATTGDIPKVLDRYLEYVARTGKPLFSWDLISCLVIKKFENVINEFAVEKTVPCIKIVNSDNLTTQDLKDECILTLNTLTGVPFTIQRVCELLLSPKKNYSKLDKFLRGFLRVIKVVTTVDRIGQKITTESQLFANTLSPFPINETGNSFSGFTGHSDDSVTSIQLHSPTGNMSSALDQKREFEYLSDDKGIQPIINDCQQPDSMETSSTKMIDQEQQTSENIYQNSNYFIEQKTISMPPIGALFKPMDQLEAFVQNVSNQVESSTTASANLMDENNKKRNSEESKDMVFDNIHLSSSLGDDYGTPTKKRKVDSHDGTREEVIVISSSDVLEKESESSRDKMDLEMEAVPTMSSQASICVEEPSSTNELKLVERKQHIDMIDLETTINDVVVDKDGDEVCGTTTVDAGNPNNQSVEADQSNCDELDNKKLSESEESLSSSSCESNVKESSVGEIETNGQS